MEKNKWGYLLGGAVIGLILMYWIAPSIGTKTQNVSTGSTDQEKANKELVQKYEDLTFEKRDVNAAVLLLADNFKQHNPTIPDGKDGFINGVGGFLLKQNPNLKIVTKRIVAEGDLVVLHSFGKFDNKNPAERGVAVVDIFRIENGKIAEHWDVIETIPEQPANSNTMF
jgi:predicted SnoaL-like aldol condensation-catalyzing enzyme